jgi:hypothetical protein
MLHVLRWSLPGGETAHCGVRWRKTTDESYDAVTASLLSSRGTTLWDSLKVVYANETAYVGSTVRVMTPLNKTESTYEFQITPVPGTSTANPLPHEVAIVASLRTATAGKSYRGRIYLPPPAVTMVGEDARFVATSRQSFTDLIAAYLAPLPGVALLSVVASVTKGAYSPITEARVGDVFDAQRRRRNELIEVYSVAAVV